MPLTHFSIPDLPIAESLPRLVAVLGVESNAVLVAPPGAGKTTCVPLALLGSAPMDQGRILMLEPRRLAARAAASRMAGLIGEKVGQTVGFRTRLESAVSSVTRIEVVTTGLFVRRLLGDPGLEGVSAVILDEIHERSLEADLALALCLDAQAMLRPDLRLLAMSATLDGARLSAIMKASIIESTGRTHPVEIRHAARDLPNLRDLPEMMARAIRAALAEAPGDILAFLPGMAEIRRTEAALDGIDAVVLPLHGDLPPAAQDLALRPAQGRRVVLATAIAETSLTVPGVRIVIDGGFRRAPRFDPASGLTRLRTERVSRAVAEQRTGRAGREAPGLAIRLWTSAAQRGLRPYDRPEILDAELSGFVLDCAAWGTPPGKLAFLDAPPEGAISAARALLTELGAMDEGAITALGKRMNALGAHPRLSVMMLAAEGADQAARACDIAALLEARDPLGARPDTPADIMARLEAIEEPSAAPGADRNAIHGIRQAAKQYRTRLGIRATQGAAGNPAPLIAAAFPDRLAQRRGEPGSFRLSGGGGAKLPLTDPLAKASLLAVAALEMKTSPRITMAAPLDLADLPAALAARIKETVETSLDPVTGSVMARRRKCLGALVLEERSASPDAADAAAALLEAIRNDPSRLLWTEAARNVQARLALMHGLEPGIWPASDDASLIANLGDWLGPHLHGLTRLGDVAALDLTALLLERLDWPLRHRLDKELPAHLILPGGRRAAVDYTEPVPIAAARAQHFYGLAETPKLAGGRVPLRLALLSPAGRPIALTADIAGFWKGAWADARRDMRGRYPKHNWPENPLLP
jgi:ATP-dependent helicase HrpB